MNVKSEWVVWWFEVDNFDGKHTRNYRDFVEYEKAIDFLRDQHRSSGNIGRIIDQPWHHSHA